MLFFQFRRIFKFSRPFCKDKRRDSDFKNKITEQKLNR